MNRQALWLGAVTALLVALFGIAGTAVAQMEGVSNQAETCVSESCNSGNVAEMEVEGGGLGVFLNLGVIAGDNNLTVNDAFNTDVSVTQRHEGGPGRHRDCPHCQASIEIPGLPEVGGVNNEAETCVGGSCNSGNVAEVEMENGLGISIGNIIAPPPPPEPIEGAVRAQQDGLLEIELPCTIAVVNVGVIPGGPAIPGAGSGIDPNAVCNSSVDVDQSQR